MDIQTEVQKIHHQFGISEKANYEIQKLFDKAIKEVLTEQLRKQAVVMKSVLADLRNQLERSRQVTQSFDGGEGRWRDGMESGLETAIELLEDALKKHFS